MDVWILAYLGLGAFAGFLAGLLGIGGAGSVKFGARKNEGAVCGGLIKFPYHY
jgi:hypothetical protein